jgi:hypothetical protein
MIGGATPTDLRLISYEFFKLDKNCLLYRRISRNQIKGSALYVVWFLGICDRFTKTRILTLRKHVGLTRFDNKHIIHLFYIISTDVTYLIIYESDYSTKILVIPNTPFKNVFFVN